MSFTLKPADLENAKKADNVQKKSKADLKSAAGKTGVKFIAAKGCVIGGKTVNLFIVTDNPTAFETVLKAKQPKAYRARGTCDVTKVKSTFNVAIKTAAGQMTAETVTQLVKAAVVSDKSIVAVNARGAVGPGLGGVPNWAKKDYKQESKETLVVSQTPKGEIGSIYFDGRQSSTTEGPLVGPTEGRIRTTHYGGPQLSVHDGTTTLQFNINRKLARAEFEQAEPVLAKSEHASREFNKWLSNRLKDVTDQTSPKWAKRVTGPQTAPDPKKKKEAPSKDVKLFEIFLKVSGEVQTWHPSRGAAVKLQTDKQTVAVLNAGIDLINKDYPLPEPLPEEDEQIRIIKLRNQTFYDFVKSRLPESEIIKAMRDPKNVVVKAKQAKKPKARSKKK